jgi:hypothetical protein
MASVFLAGNPAEGVPGAGLALAARLAGATR